MIDTHAHLDALDDADAAVARALEAGVQRVLMVGTDPAGCVRALELADSHDGVYAILGIHPHEANTATGADVDQVRALLVHPRAVGVGEMGLDWFRDYAPRDKQRRLFEQMLGVAEDTGKPAVIHTRAADEDTVAVLQDFRGDVVLHCFSSPHLLGPALERGWYCSFAGNITYKNASELRVAATQVPADRLLVETDCPYLAPQAVRGKTNEPAYVVHTVAALADARGEDVGELAAQIDRNAAACFGLPQ